MALMSHPNRLGLPTCVPAKPPTKSPLLKIISSIADPSPRRDDGEVDAACSHGREREQHTDGDREDTAGEQRERERPAGRVDEAAGDPRAEAGQRELPERQLTGVARDHHQRQQHEADGERGDEGVLPLEGHPRMTKNVTTSATASANGWVRPVPTAGSRCRK